MAKSSTSCWHHQLLLFQQGMNEFPSARNRGEITTNCWKLYQMRKQGIDQKCIFASFPDIHIIKCWRKSINAVLTKFILFLHICVRTHGRMNGWLARQTDQRTDERLATNGSAVDFNCKWHYNRYALLRSKNGISSSNNKMGKCAYGRVLICDEGDFCLSVVVLSLFQWWQFLSCRKNNS